MTDNRKRPIVAHSNPGKVARILSEETEKYRDKLKADDGRILTVGDTRRALQVFEDLVKGKDMPDDLTDDQRGLLDLWLDRLSK
ncbi:MAG: hypothetical protein KKA42_01925 [candidate division Zixibacteria bacterium]|nr:hypothetical protein [candidate division Zixibacteria bacterium]